MSTDTRMRTLLRHPSSASTRLFVTAVCVLTVLFAYAQRPLHIPPLPRDDRVLDFVDRNGLELGTIVGRGERRTVAVTLDSVAPAFVNAVLATEDRRFFWHGPVDPIATLRALARAPFERSVPNGASTLSMQVARMIEPVGPGFLGKVREVVLAERLEAGASKRAILEAYCNLAPMGSNLYGVEAASRTYFGVDAADLDLAQAALLAALPNDPVRLDPYRHRAALEARRRFVLARMVSTGLVDRLSADRAATENVALRPERSGIVAAPHYIFHLASQVPAGVARVRTSIDRPLQEFVETQVREVVGALGSYNVHHAAALVVDNRSGEVLAYAGSPDYFASDDFGKNDGVQALRQPGSALKPFLYELALERRAIRPDTILADVPATYAIPGARLYAPVDYSNRFLGPVRVRLALADSLNVPAVRVLERVGVEDFRKRLVALGFAHLTKPAAFYGLGLTLGGGEVSLAELARAYSNAARAAANGDPSWLLVTDILADPHARAASFGVDSILRLPFPAAVKTGTSSDFRDTWTVGYTKEYTVAVWVGNFDGAPMRGISGVTGAGPLWARIMLHLHESADPAPFESPPGYVREPMCAETGAATAPFDSAPLRLRAPTRAPLRVTARSAQGDSCAVVSEWFDREDLVRRSRIAPGGDVAGASSAYDAWLAYQPQRERLPTRILFPHDGDVFICNGGAPNQRLSIQLAGRRDVSLRVDVDGRWVVPEGGDYLWTLRPGRHELTAASARGHSSVVFTVAARSLVQHHLGFTVKR